MNHTASGLPRADRTKISGAGMKRGVSHARKTRPQISMGMVSVLYAHKIGLLRIYCTHFQCVKSCHLYAD